MPAMRRKMRNVPVNVASKPAAKARATEVPASAQQGIQPSPVGGPRGRANLTLASQPTHGKRTLQIVHARRRGNGSRSGSPRVKPVRCGEVSGSGRRRRYRSIWLGEAFPELGCGGVIDSTRGGSLPYAGEVDKRCAFFPFPGR